MSAFMLQQPLLLCRFDLFYIQLWSILLSTLHILSSAIYKSTMRSTRNAQDRKLFLIFSLGPSCIFSLMIIRHHCVGQRHKKHQVFVWAECFQCVLAPYFGESSISRYTLLNWDNILSDVKRFFWTIYDFWHKSIS